MLSELITLSFSNDGVAAPVNHIYEKRTHDSEIAVYNNQSTIVDPSLPVESMTIRQFPAKASKDFYGTRKFSLKMRKEALGDTPNGEVLMPRILEVTGSSPVVFTVAELTYMLNWCRSMLANTAMEDVYYYGRI